MIAVVDLKISNIASVLQALRLLGATEHQFAAPANLAAAEAIILPGVGAYGDGMASLREQGLIGPLRAAATAGKPILGICLGMQLLGDRSAEFGTHEGLGLVAGSVELLDSSKAGYRVPNIGWCDVSPTRTSVLFPESGGCFYHVHSYHFVAGDPRAVAATIRFGDQDITVAVEQNNLFGVQFHTEKSQDDGLKVMANFLQHVRAKQREGA